VRRRALAALGAVRGDIAEQWVPPIRRLLGDGDAGVRAAAIGALSSISQEDAASLARPLLADPDPRIRATAAVAMAGSTRAEDLDQAEAAPDLTSNTEDPPGPPAATSPPRSGDADPRFRRLLVPLLYDPAPDVADEAMESVHAQSAKDDSSSSDARLPAAEPPAHDGPGLSRRLRRAGRRDLALPARPEEDIWVRRHSRTLGRSSQKTVDVLSRR
jgi:HEAT repeat protein